jgi:hypothetical protein
MPGATSTTFQRIRRDVARVTRARSAWPAILLLACLVGCGGDGGPVPDPAFAGTLEVQRAQRELETRWVRGDAPARRALVPALVAFHARYRAEPPARTAAALLAWTSVEMGDFAAARRWAADARASGPGTNADIALLVEGAVQRRSGQPEQALRTLAPAVGKVVDPWAHHALDEEVVLAAVGARRWREALRYMRIWLREAADDDPARVGARVDALLVELPEADLLRALDGAAGSDADDAAARRLQQAIARRLARTARERKDAALAERLLGRARDLLGDESDAIARLAAGTGSARVEPQTVGLLVSVRSDDARRRAIEAAAGLAFGLGLPRGSARMVSRDDGGTDAGLEEALLALGADGAAVVVAGMTEADASAVAALAEARKVPVLLLHPPSRASTSPFVFVLGEAPQRQVQAMLGPAPGPAAVLATDAKMDARATTDARITAAASCAAPVSADPWRTAGVRTVLLAGGRACVREALPQIVRALPAATLVFGLEVGDLAQSGQLVLTAGAYPAEGRVDDADMRRWVDAQGAWPGWWSGLGRDAGVLALAALRGLPPVGAERAAEVEQRRAAVARALATAAGALWTTEARAFAVDRTLPRSMSLRAVR